MEHKSDRCTSCGDSNVHALGLCRPCYKHDNYLKHRPIVLARVRAWKQANPDRISASNRRRYPIRKEKIIASNTRWRAANPDRVRDIRENARARARGLFIEDVSRVAVYAAYDGRCGICEQPLAFAEMVIDHIVPLVRGGLHAFTNIQPAHDACNRRKGASVSA